jgi:hypothetical protein
MSNQRPSFAKREREMKLKDKARAKAERRAARRASRTGGGPPVATDDVAGVAAAANTDSGPDASPTPAVAPPPDRPR